MAAASSGVVVLQPFGATSARLPSEVTPGWMRGFWSFGSPWKRDSSRGRGSQPLVPGAGRRLGVPRLSEAVARPTRLETRTKESAGCASRRVHET